MRETSHRFVRRGLLGAVLSAAAVVAVVVAGRRQPDPNMAGDSWPPVPLNPDRRS